MISSIVVFANGHTIMICSVNAVFHLAGDDSWCSTLHIFFTNQLEPADNRYDESRSTDINRGERKPLKEQHQNQTKSAELSADVCAVFFLLVFHNISGSKCCT